MIFFYLISERNAWFPFFLLIPRKNLSLFQWKKFVFHTESHQNTHTTELFIRFYDSESASIQLEIFLLINPPRFCAQQNRFPLNIIHWIINGFRLQFRFNFVKLLTLFKRLLFLNSFKNGRFRGSRISVRLEFVCELKPFDESLTFLTNFLGFSLNILNHLFWFWTFIDKFRDCYRTFY